jgi:hypothetical protein
MRFLSIVLCFSCLGCVVGAEHPLTPAGQSVRLGQSDAPPGCKEIGTVSGNGMSMSYEEQATRAKNDMRNTAAERGANFVRLEGLTNDPQGGSMTATGTAYACPAPAAAPQ